MAFGTSRIFRSTDVGAPQFNNAAGSLNAVLKAVLCTGYGSTESLGWTVEFESGNVLVVRMKGGTRTFIQFDDTLTGIYTYVAAYSTMSSAFTGTERMPAAGQPACYLMKTYVSGSTVNIPWTIIGDDAGFYLLTKPQAGNSSVNIYYKDLQSIIYIGDYVQFDLRNKWNFCLLTTAIASTGVGIHAHAAATNIPHYIQRASTFERGSIFIGLYANGVTDYGILSIPFSPTGVNVTSISDAILFNGQVLNLGPIFLYAMVTGSSTYVKEAYACYGILPGLGAPGIAFNYASNVANLTSPSPDIAFTSATENFTTLLCAIRNTYPYVGNNIGAVAYALLRVGEGFRNV